MRYVYEGNTAFAALPTYGIVAAHPALERVPLGAYLPGGLDRVSRCLWLGQPDREAPAGIIDMCVREDGFVCEHVSIQHRQVLGEGWSASTCYCPRLKGTGTVHPFRLGRLTG